MENVEMYKIIRSNGELSWGWNLNSLKDKISSPVMRPQLALIDLDGTIRQGSHRLHLLPSQEEIAAAGDTPNIAFTRFNEAGDKDKPIQPVIDLVNMFYEQGYYIIILTSCTHSDKTLSTMVEQLDIWEVPYHAAVMRGKDNHRWPVEYKEMFLHDVGIVGYNGNVVALDDCVDNCNKFREYGILALQVEDYSRFNKGDTK
jgi:hypothetical protein